MFANPVQTRSTMVFALLLFLLPALAVAADPALERTATAMGAGGLKSIRYSGDGVGYTFGQAYKPGLAWNQVANAPVAGPRFAADRIHQLWITPQGVVKVAIKNNATVREEKRNGQTYAAASFAEPGRFKEKAVIKDGTRTVDLYHVADSHHSDNFLMVYLPKEKLLIEADSFTPLPPNAPAPVPANPLHVNLVDNLGQLKMPVDRILPLHGRVVPASDLYAAVGQPAPK